jgi:hypothetical protein
MNRSQKAARYGSLAEKAAFQKYGLTPDYDSWHDARDDQGDPWDVKACMLSRRSPRFRLWKEQHHELRENDGGYVFVGYRPSGRGIAVVQTRTLRAADLELSFYGAGQHQKGQQMKLPPSKVLEL